MEHLNWERLHRYSHDRVAHLAIKQDEFKALGGPSPAWFRRLDTNTGGVTSRNRDKLEALDHLCLWEAGTSRRILEEDVSALSDDVIEDQRQMLVYGDDLRVSQRIRAFQMTAARMLSNMSSEDADDAMNTILEALGWPSDQ